MTQATLEERVATLERQVAALLSERQGNGRVKNWRRLIGAFTGDDVMKQIFEEGRKIREADRREARKRYGKKRPAKS